MVITALNKLSAPVKLPFVRRRLFRFIPFVRSGMLAEKRGCPQRAVGWPSGIAPQLLPACVHQGFGAVPPAFLWSGSFQPGPIIPVAAKVFGQRRIHHEIRTANHAIKGPVFRRLAYLIGAGADCRRRHHSFFF